jgi:hypothetical protein
LKALFTPPPAGSIPQAVLDALDKAVSAYLATKDAQRKRLEEMESLKSVASTDKRTLQSVQAGNKMEKLASQEFGQKVSFSLFLFSYLPYLSHSLPLSTSPYFFLPSYSLLNPPKFAEMQALKAKKEAEIAMANAPKVDPFAEEQKRLEEERCKKEEADKKAKEDSRARLAAKASLWK